MGCGSSNVLESSNLKSHENKFKDMYIKLMNDRKLINSKFPEFNEGVAHCKEIQDYRDLAQDLRETHPSFELTEKEISQAGMLIKVNSMFSDSKIPNWKIDHDFFSRVFSRMDEDGEDAKICNQLTLKNLGNSNSACSLNIDFEEDEEELVNIAFLHLRFNETFHQESVALIIQPHMINIRQAMIQLGQFVSENKRLMNFGLAVMKEQTDKRSKTHVDWNNLIYLFEGLSHNLNLRNLGFLNFFPDENMEFKIDTSDKFNQMLKVLDLTGLAIVNYKLSGFDLKGLGEFTTRKANLNWFAYQDSIVDQDKLIKISEYVTKSKSLEFVGLGANEGLEKMCRDKIRSIILTGKNKIRTVVIDMFESI